MPGRYTESIIFDKETGEEIKRFGADLTDSNKMRKPTNLTVDEEGYIYVTDTGNARVMKFDPRGKFIIQIGQLSDSPGSFHRPKGVAVDRKGIVYVVDSSFNNVQLFNDEAQLLMYFGKGGDAPGSMNLPAHITVDYENVDLFADKVAPEHEIECLIIVTSQFGLHKVNVYGLLKSDE